MLARTPLSILDSYEDKTVGEFSIRIALIEAVADEHGPEAFARLHKLNEEYVKDVVKGATIISAKLLRILGFEKVTRYRRRVW